VQNIGSEFFKGEAQRQMLKKIRYGDMALCWHILMGLMMGYGLKDTDAQSAAQS